MSTATAAARRSPEAVRKASQARSFVARLAIGIAAVCWLGAAIAYGYGQWHARAVSEQMSRGVVPAHAETLAQSIAVELAAINRAAIIAGAMGLCCLLVLPLLRGPKQDWERILDLVLQHPRSMRLMLLGSITGVLVTMSLPLLLDYILGDVVNEQRDQGKLLLYAGLITFLLLLRAAASYLRTFHGQALAYRTVTALRNRLFGHLQKLSFGFFDRSRQGELMSRLTNDVLILQEFIRNGSEDFIVAPLSVLAGLAGVFWLNWKLAVVILALALLIGFLMQLTFRRMKKLYESTQREMGNLTAQMAEGINTIRLAQSFGLEEDSLGRFRETNRKALSSILGHAKLQGKLQPAIELLGFIAPLLFIFVLSWLAIAESRTLEVDEFVAIVAYAALVMNPLGKLSRVMVTLTGGATAMHRIQEVLDTRAEIADKRDAPDLPEVQGRIVFDRVSLSYGRAGTPAGHSGEADKSVGPTALSNIDLTIEPGQVVAFVGESGSGKSSLIHLVPRFYEPSAGRVLLDNYDLRDVTLASLRGSIGIVSQDTILVHGTIRDNIAYGSPHADEKDIVDASISANANSFIMELPQGYDTMVGERGVTLSGGQRQRIAIARALLRDPRILLLDEATSALDSVAEALVQDALNKLMYGRTTLMVAHRLSTVRNADRIIVLKQGRIVEQGSHEELLARGGEYARLVKLQGVA